MVLEGLHLRVDRSNNKKVDMRINFHSLISFSIPHPRHQVNKNLQHSALFLFWKFINKLLLIAIKHNISIVSQYLYSTSFVNLFSVHIFKFYPTMQ